MELVIDLAIALAALLAAAYCMVLSRRLQALTRLDGDVGKAIAVLSQQIDALTKALQQAESTNTQASSTLGTQIERADAAARRLELMMAANRGNDASPPQTDEATSVSTKHVETTDSTADFAPFGRAGGRNADARPRVLRHREPYGVTR